MLLYVKYGIINPIITDGRDNIMRTISYKCDRCGKPVLPRSITKINLAMQKGSESVEKKTYDFCSVCFLSIKSDFLKSLEYTGCPDAGIKDKAADNKPEETDAAKEISENNAVENPEKSDRSSLNTGLITVEERNEILRLFVEENLPPEKIAQKLNRLPRGIKRTINTAAKSGEIDKLRSNFMSRSVKEPENISESTDENTYADETDSSDNEEDESESYSGSGASNSHVVKDSYTNVPKTVKINGKKYDVGYILALQKAGWTIGKIADEKHYDEDVIRVITEKYKPS